RTYALELAWLGLDGTAFAKLRQQLLSATVENKPKLEWLRDMYGERFRTHEAMFTEQQALGEVLGNLKMRKNELSNPHIVRLIEGYFVEMAVVVSEMGRILRPGGTVFMVNDNVQYHGEELPVDCILSDFAEQSGLECKTIWKLARGKGNSSQQMGKFGRREIRKCIYEWIKP
ncbi:MAG: site-specific DNA-methyltransferase, partial [Gammaproteobacteria bacterium]|nr:site-specific DNA-methyltransferase [Gammaproteobacteria bacterium]